MSTLIGMTKVIGTATVLMFSYVLVALAGDTFGDAVTERKRAYIEDIQEALYFLGYLKIDDVDGVAGPKTSIAIRRFETENGLEVVGKLNDDLRTLLIDVAFPDLPKDPDLVGAISVANDFKWGAAYARYTTEVARAIAVRRCLQRSKTRLFCDEHVAVGSGYGWMVTVVCGGVYASAAEVTLEAAEALAIKTARDSGNRSQCSRLLATNATFGEVIDPDEERMLLAPDKEVPTPARRVDPNI